MKWNDFMSEAISISLIVLSGLWIVIKKIISTDVGPIIYKDISRVFKKRKKATHFALKNSMRKQAIKGSLVKKELEELLMENNLHRLIVFERFKNGVHRYYPTFDFIHPEVMEPMSSESLEDFRLGLKEDSNFVNTLLKIFKQKNEVILDGTLIEYQYLQKYLEKVYNVKSAYFYPVKINKSFPIIVGIFFSNYQLLSSSELAIINQKIESLKQFLVEIHLGE